MKMAKEKEVKELKEEIELMLSALVELLKEKGILKYEEWERIKENEKLKRI